LARRGGFFDLAGKEKELAGLRERAASPDLWADPTEAKAVSQKLSRYETILATVDRLQRSLDDAGVLLDLADEHDDRSSREEAMAELTVINRAIAKLEMEALYFGEYDDRDAILSVHAGAGGVDAQDWAQMLVRMYQRFLADAGFGVTLDEVTEGEEAGIKSATLNVKGDRAYATLEGERGVHRLVRISPFDANARRHTSFAGVDVVPQVEDAEVEIREDDLRIDTYRSQGAGGQHVNTTDSAVRITHLPTGIVVTCQNERSQLQNRAKAMQHLRAKLADLARQERAAQLDQIRGEQGEAAWGRQIRSYVLQPYQMVKDLRTGVEVGNVNAVLDGDLEPFMSSYLRWRRGRLERAQG
jgi:peptide chain release factor 2